MSNFEDRLWHELVRDHGAELARIRRPPRRRVRPRVLAGTTVALAALGTALVLVLGATRSAPAFAVTTNSDGTVTLTIKEIAGIASANARLAALGVRARAVPVQVRCTGRVQDRTGMLRATPRGSAALLRVRIDPAKIPAGKTLVLGAQRGGRPSPMLLAAALAHGAAPACLAEVHAKVPPIAQRLLHRAGECRRVETARRHGAKPPAEFRRLLRLAPFVRVEGRRARKAPAPPFVACRR